VCSKIVFIYCTYIDWHAERLIWFERQVETMFQLYLSGSEIVIPADSVYVFVLNCLISCVNLLTKLYQVLYSSKCKVVSFYFLTFCFSFLKWYFVLFIQWYDIPVQNVSLCLLLVWLVELKRMQVLYIRCCIALLQQLEYLCISILVFLNSHTKLRMYIYATKLLARQLQLFILY